MMVRANQGLNPTSKRIMQLMKGHTDRGEEAEILKLLGDADGATLNESLQQLDLSDLFSDIDDHWLGPKNKTALMKMLGEDRLPELEISSRAAVIDGLQRGWTSYKDSEKIEPKSGGIEENAIRATIVGTPGIDLTRLKNEVNAGADKYDMHHLMHSDVDSESFRTEIFGHIAEQAKLAPSGQIKPLSDIDDTFYSSLKDERYPGETVYPGVLAFYDELDRGATESKPDPLGDLTFLTARPDEETGTVKNRTHQTLRANGVKEASILLGSLTGLINHEAMAKKKMENFEQYAELYPEYDFTWTGDSGQGDAILGERMLERYPDRVKGVFIHNVTNLTTEEKQAFREKGVRIFDTYLGAAVEAYDAGLISKAGLSRVADASTSDLAAIEFESPEQKAARQGELDIDLARAQERIRKR